MVASNTAEVSKKIRAAIKAKLEELGVYVDEELPDYIMVMIANKKEKSQMKEDLLLFLGKNAAKFVDWLFEIFERLQSVGAGPLQELSSSDSKKKVVVESSEKKQPEDASKTDREGAEKKHGKRKHENLEKTKEAAKEQRMREKRAKERLHEKIRERDRKETDRGAVKVVKSKPVVHRVERSPVLSLEKVRSTSRRTENSGREKEISHDRRSNETTSKRSEKRESRREVRVKATAKVEISKAEKEGISEAKKKRCEEGSYEKNSQLSKNHEKSPSPLKRKSSTPPLPEYDSDEEERLAEEESAKDLKNKKVQSSAVTKLVPEPTPKSVSSQVIVKRKLPEKEITTKQSRGVKSLFLKAIKDAGETTRTASQIAGYGGASSAQPVATVAKVDDYGRKKVEIRTAEKNKAEIRMDDDGSMGVNNYDDTGDDALIVMPVGRNEIEQQTRRSVVERETEVIRSKETKKKRIHGPLDKDLAIDETKFFITLKGNSLSGLSKRVTRSGETKSRKRRNVANPILAHLNLSGSNIPKKVMRQEIMSKERDVQVNFGDDVENEAEIVVSTPDVCGDAKRTPSWDLQIQLEDTSEDDNDDEAQIDAVLASTNAEAVSVGFDEIPPTPALSKPEFLPQLSPQLEYLTSRSIYTLNNQNSASPAVSFPPSNEKIMERCKFWPNCSLDGCVYIHPSKPCSNFPNCLFRDRCVYVHPPCKFDRSCTNAKCNYAHPFKTKKQSAATDSPTVAKAVPEVLTPESEKKIDFKTKVPCKYGNKCANSSCCFKHPKLCRFGDSCLNRGCHFWHPKSSALAVLSGPGQYKWKASPTAAH